MRIVRAALSALGASGALVAAGALAVRAFGMEQGPLPVVVAATPYAVALAAGAAVLLLLGGSRFWLGACVAVLLVLGATQAPLLVQDGGPAGEGSGDGLTVLTANLRRGFGDAGQVVATVRERNVDVLGVQELTPGAEERLRRAGLARLLPYSYVQAGPSSTGTGLWSRTPLTGQRRLSGFAQAEILARTAVAGGRPSTLVVVHPVRPDLHDSSRWAREQDRLHDELAGLSGDVLVLGDFNATPDHRPMRRLAADGWHDAADQAGAGLNRTWPVGQRIPGPLFAIDHVLVRGPLRARAVETVTVPGSDHLAVLTQFTVVATPGARG